MPDIEFGRIQFSLQMPRSTVGRDPLYMYGVNGLWPIMMLHDYGEGPDVKVETGPQHCRA